MSRSQPFVTWLYPTTTWIVNKRLAKQKLTSLYTRFFYICLNAKYISTIPTSLSLSVSLCRSLSVSLSSLSLTHSLTHSLTLSPSFQVDMKDGSLRPAEQSKKRRVKMEGVKTLLSNNHWTTSTEMNLYNTPQWPRYGTALDRLTACENASQAF